MTTASVPSPFTYSGSELDSLAEAVNYYRFISGQFAPHLGERVVEVGAGIGTFAEYLLRGPTRARQLKQLTLIEPAENNLPLLRNRFDGDARVTAAGGYLEAHAATLRADALVAVNVLEHVADDVAFLRAARQVLAPTGRLLLYVPALPAIFGSLDRAFEHYRRYTKQVLNVRLRVAGFRPQSIRYVNLPGVLSWFVAGRVLRRTTIAPRDVRLYDRYVVPWVSWLDQRIEPPFGQSLIAVAVPNA
jgi:SAM-dependent methyltransferase